MAGTTYRLEANFTVMSGVLAGLEERAGYLRRIIEECEAEGHWPDPIHRELVAVEEVIDDLIDEGVQS